LAALHVPADRVNLRIRAAAGRLTLVVHTSTEAFAFDGAWRGALRQIEERLRALYGDALRFDTGPAPQGGSQACVEAS
jgi:signal transduction histidine kinase